MSATDSFTAGFTVLVVPQYSAWPVPLVPVWRLIGKSTADSPIGNDMSASVLPLRALDVP